MSLELFDLNGKIALITGSSRGLGFTIAQGLGEAGATIVANGVNEQRLNEAVKTLSELDYVNGHILYIDGGMLSCV